MLTTQFPRRRPTWMGGLALILAASWGTACSSCHKSRHPGNTHAEADLTQAEGADQILSRPTTLASDRPGRPVDAAGALGVNEGVSIPVAWVRQGRVSPDQEAPLLATDAAALSDLGTRIVRANTATYPWLSRKAFTARGSSFDQADRWVSAVLQAGLEPLMMLGPWPGNQTAAHTQTYVPRDLAAYQRWVASVVERYDGDGIDDMPGLGAGVHYWEVDNEPDLHNSVPPRGGGATTPPEDFETPAQYATVLVATSAAIKGADPTAVVLNGGLYRPHTDNGRTWLAELLAQPGATEAFDILSLHCYSDRNDLGAQTRTLQAWRELVPDKPLWVTETSVASSGRAPHIDQEWQGSMVAATVGLMLAGGADRIFWHSLADPPQDARHGKKMPFSSHSLLQSTQDGHFEDKPAGAVYRRLAGLLTGVDLDSAAERPATGGRLLQTSGGWLAFWGQPELPPGAFVITDLLTGRTHPSAGSPGETVASPAWLSPAG